MVLIIAEKPSLARNIVAGIGKMDKKDGYFENLSFDEFVKRIAEFYNDVNYIHPFREGNGRTQRIYFTQLIRHYGYDINFADVDTDELMIATIQASSGVIDFLVEFFENSIIIPDSQTLT